jgi:CheY-like chemotaxis protein
MNLPLSTPMSPNLPAHDPSLVLVIEDNDEDYEALERAFRQSSVATKLHRCKTGKQALEYLGQCVPSEPTCFPAFILLDLNLPGIDGCQIIQIIKQDARLQSIPVIVLTTSNYTKDIEECYRSGVNSYVVKAMDVQRFKDTIQTLIQYWLKTVTIPW